MPVSCLPVSRTLFKLYSIFSQQIKTLHIGGLACLRQHQPPLEQGLENVVDIAKDAGFRIDGTSSKTLQQTLSQMGLECEDKLLMQCVTEMLMTPMRPAEYIAAGCFDADEWRHFALNIPYYTHFTSPIRRYPDIIVHRLLQATLDGGEAVKNYRQSKSEIQSVCEHCNEKRMDSKKAQERSDRVFLSLFLKANPIRSTLGVVVSIGEKAFTVFVPKLGITTMVFLDEHKDRYNASIQKNDKGQRKMTLLPIKENTGKRVDIKLFTKIAVSCICKEKPPIDVSLRVVGNWIETQ
jgi:DIS3-like exonuclease 2